jgi:hypothetical protein
MECKNCGTSYPDYAENCPACGAYNPYAYKAQQERQPRHAQAQPQYQQSQQQQPRYQQPVNNVYVSSDVYHDDEHVSTWGWIGRWLILCIPIVNLIMLFVWAFGGTKKRSLKTWARAHLLLSLICIIAIAITVIILTANGVDIKTIFNGTWPHRLY